jgi:hypothetical protein
VGNYTATVTFNDVNCTDTVFDVPFSILYSENIITQRWNDVLSVINATTQSRLLYGGKPGDEFTSYQWYKNGVEIPKATGSYLYVPEGLDMTACYSVRLVRSGETVEQAMMSCEYCPVYIAGDITINPTLARRGESLNVEVPEKANVTVFDISGVKVAEQKVLTGKSTLKAPNNVGIYLYKITLDSGEERTFRISVVK